MLLLTRGLLTLFLHSKSVHQRRDNRFSKAARDAHDGWVFFVEKVAWVVGEFELAAKYEVLIVIKHAVLVLIAHGYRGGDGHFKNARAALVVQQDAGKGERLDHAIDHRIGAFALALHAQAMTAANQFVHHG